MTHPTIVRRSARAVLFDDEGHLVTIRRTKPGERPYWTTPGGGVAPDDPSRAAAAARELGEEIGAIARIGPQVFLHTMPSVPSMPSGPWGNGVQVAHFFLSRLVAFDARLRTGPEHSDPGRGTYEPDRIPLDRLAHLDFRPAELRRFILANAAALLADLPDPPGRR